MAMQGLPYQVLSKIKLNLVKLWLELVSYLLQVQWLYPSYALMIYHYFPFYPQTITGIFP
jgi:hypothetical protein